MAADNITKFLKGFPDLEEGVINAVYDLCEDNDSKVCYHSVSHLPVSHAL